MIRLAKLVVAVTAVVTSVSLVAGAGYCQAVDYPGLDLDRDWPWWRGPERNGYAAPEAMPPVRFGESENVLWQASVPGRGHSSPIVVGDRVFLTTANEDQQLHSVLAYDFRTGAQLWKQDVSRGGFPEDNHPKNTDASSTLACDGQRLFATFFHDQQIELFALSLDGQVVWKKRIGSFNPRRFEYGYAPSPLIYCDAVIAAGEYDGASWLAGFERSSGTELWRVLRPNNITFSSPVVASIQDRDQLLMCGARKISAYDPNNGELLWSVPGCSAATCGTMVWNDAGLVFASGGYPESETIAVRADGSQQIVWKNNRKCYEQSMITVDGFVYGLTDRGILYCWRADDGRQMWRERLNGPVSASPVYARGLIYWANESGTMYVFRPNSEEFELVAENRLGNSAFASPAVVGNKMLIRVAQKSQDQRQEYLICVGTE